jgi:ubiquinone/menaquinone biosynthesis C-methylase UbiE
LDKLRATYPDITTVVSDIESLPFEDNSFDTYIGMRTLHASNIDLDKALNEALRVTTKTWIISVSNGYVVEGEVVKGMYDYDNGEILKDLPYRYVDEIVEFFKKHNIQSHTEETTSEIIIVAKSL